MRDPDKLVYFREEVGGLVLGGYERNPAPWELDGIPAGFNHTLLAPTGSSSRRCWRPRSGASRRWRRRARQADQRPRGLHARRRVHPGRGARGRAASGWPAASAPTASPAPAASGGHGRMDRRRRPRRSTSGTWTCAASARSTAQPAGARRAAPRDLRDVLRHPLPRPGARDRARAAAVAGLPAAPELGAVFGEKAGWERANWFEPNAAAGSEARRPRGFAGRVWSPAIEAEHRATRERAALFDETSFAKFEVPGRARSRCSSGSPPTTWTGPSARSPTPQMLNRAGRNRVRLHRDPARGRPLPDRHRHRLWHPRPGWIAATSRATGRCDLADVTAALRLSSACADRAPGTCSRR